jgi:hypothetical protein
MPVCVLNGIVQKSSARGDKRSASVNINIEIEMKSINSSVHNICNIVSKVPATTVDAVNTIRDLLISLSKKLSVDRRATIRLNRHHRIWLNARDSGRFRNLGNFSFRRVLLKMHDM